MLENFRLLKMQKKIFLKNNSAGFTLTELMIVVSIIALLSVIFIANYRSGDRQLGLQRSAHQLAHDIRRAKAMAMATEEFGGDIPDGYGIYFEENATKYVLFAFFDDNGSRTYETIEELDFEKRQRAGVFIEKIEVEGGAADHHLQRRLRIIFLPPDPTVEILSHHAPGAPNLHDRDKANITLNYEGGTDKIRLQIKVNKAGLIEIE